MGMIVLERGPDPAWDWALAWWGGSRAGLVATGLGWWPQGWAGGHGSGLVAMRLGWWPWGWARGHGAGLVGIALGWWPRVWAGGHGSGLVATGLGWWPWGWVGGRGHLVHQASGPCADSTEADARGCNCCVGSVAPICCLGLGLSPLEQWVPHPYVSTHTYGFTGIRCLDIKLSRCRCVGWAKIFLSRSNMQLMPMIENLMWSRRYF